MPTDKTIIQQTKEEQKRVFRIAMDPNRYGLTLKAISMDAQIGYDSLRDYACGDTEMPLSALRRLVGVVPDELLSLLLPGERLIVRQSEQTDHDEFAEKCMELVKETAAAHRPDSEMAEKIGPNESARLRRARIVLAAVA